MPNLYVSAPLRDGFINSGNQSTWAAARDHAGNALSDNSSATSNLVGARRFPSRGGGNLFQVSRAFYHFNTAGITSISSATIKIYGYGSSTSGSCIAVKSTAFGGDGNSDLVVGDFDAIVGYQTASDLSGSVTEYSSPIESGEWDNTTYNDLTGTSDLVNDMRANDDVIICLMDYNNDYKNEASTDNLYIGAYSTEWGGTSKDPYIEYALATGYGNKVLGVDDSNIAKVYGVATADIEKVIGV
tara:strand:+ start:1946 stop:2674 length:729 start_codon:yes stop_codon:yes gene_type:complete